MPKYPPVPVVWDAPVAGNGSRLGPSGVPVTTRVMMADHTVSESIYVEDPDGNWVELYVDVSDVWRSTPQAVATVKQLAL